MHVLDLSLSVIDEPVGSQLTNRAIDEPVSDGLTLQNKCTAVVVKRCEQADSGLGVARGVRCAGVKYLSI